MNSIVLAAFWHNYYQRSKFLFYTIKVNMMFALTMIVELEWHDGRLKYKNLREGRIFVIRLSIYSIKYLLYYNI